MMYTIGTSNKPLEVLTGRLLEHKIDLVIDVRARPYSRFQPWHNKKNLILEFEKIGIGYEWQGEILGGGMEYSETPMEEFEELVKRLVVESSDKNIALMCSEGSPYPTKYLECGCHRYFKISQFINKHYPEVVIQHILMDGSLEKSESNDYREKWNLDWNGDKISDTPKLLDL